MRPTRRAGAIPAAGEFEDVDRALLDPPIAPGGGGGGGSNYPTNPVFFDTFGSRFRAGVRVRY